jgi:hypothetical protein
MDDHRTTLGHVGGGGDAGKPLSPVQFGSLVRMKTAYSVVYGMVSGMWISDPEAPIDQACHMIEVELIGQASDGTDGRATVFQRGVAFYPELGGAIEAVNDSDLTCIYARPAESNVRVGSVHHHPHLPAFVATDALLGKHFAILGTTGTGKSCAATLIMHAVLDAHPNGHVVLLDPHNEYYQAFGDMAEVITPANLHLPYWLMNFEESLAVFADGEGPERRTEAAILKDAIVEARKKFAGTEADTTQLTVDSPVPYRLSELQRIIQAAMGRLDKPESTVPYLRLLSRIEALSADKRFSFMFSGVVVRDSMADVLSRILRVPVEGRPITIIDLSGVPSEMVDVVVSVMCRTIFDFAVWSAESKAVPVLLVCEEAHRYVPSDERLGFGPTRRALSRIAKEGRKYGVSLCLVSQRPSELSTSILSQCNTIFALRMTNEHDQHFVRKTLPEGARALLEALPTLDTQEAIAAGTGVTLPMRIRFDDLAADYRPKSGTAEFSTAWQADRLGKPFIRETIDRWRRQQRESPLALTA